MSNSHSDEFSSDEAEHELRPPNRWPPNRWPRWAKIGCRLSTSPEPNDNDATSTAIVNPANILDLESFVKDSYLELLDSNERLAVEGKYTTINRI